MSIQKALVHGTKKETYIGHVHRVHRSKKNRSSRTGVKGKHVQMWGSRRFQLKKSIENARLKDLENE